MRGNPIGSIEQLLRAYRYQGFPVVTNQEEMLVVGYVTREMIIKALTKARTQLGLLDTCRVFFTNDIPVSRDAPLFDLR
jgi:predicted transcriptional regulator